MIVLGMISGTSVDAIDTALVQFTEDTALLHMRLLATYRHPMPPRVRAGVFGAIPPGRGSTRRVCALDAALGEAFAEAACAAIEAAGRSPDLIASHGQTLYHQVDDGGRAMATLQAGQPAIVAERTGVTVAADFRPRDVAAGGQGAPLVSLLDVMCFRDPYQTRAAQNIGGIANCTILPAGGGEAFAFDSGPGNGLIDHAAVTFSGGKLQCDTDGAWAARGEVSKALLDELLAHPYYAMPPPKSTGKELFGPAYGDDVIARGRALGLGDAHILATLTMLTARTIADGYARFTDGVDEIILGGGGLYNPTLMQMLTELLPGVPLHRADAFGIPAQSKEAVAFALLGYHLAHGRPGNVPGCTGARQAVPLGVLVPGDNFHVLVADCLARREHTVTRLKVEI